MGASNLDDRKLRELYALLAKPATRHPLDELLSDLFFEFIEVQAGVAGIITRAIGGNAVRLGEYDPADLCDRIASLDGSKLSPSDREALSDWKIEALELKKAADYIRSAQ